MGDWVGYVTALIQCNDSCVEKQSLTSHADLSCYYLFLTNPCICGAGASPAAWGPLGRAMPAWLCLVAFSSTTWQQDALSSWIASAVTHNTSTDASAACFSVPCSWLYRVYSPNDPLFLSAECSATLRPAAGFPHHTLHHVHHLVGSGQCAK